MSKSSCKTIELGAYHLDEDCTLPKEKLKSLTERLRSPLQLSGVDSIVTHTQVSCIRKDIQLFLCS